MLAIAETGQNAVGEGQKLLLEPLRRTEVGNCWPSAVGEEVPERPPLLLSPGDDDDDAKTVVVAAVGDGGDGCWPSTPDEYKDQ